MWRLGDQRGVDLSRRSAQLVEQEVQCGERAAVKRASAGGTPGRRAKRCAERQKIARIGGLQGDTAQQSLDVEDAIHGATQFLALDHVCRPCFDGIEAGVDLVGVDRGTQHPGAQQALAHRRHGGVEGAEESYAVANVGEEWVDQLEIADGHGVEHEAVLALVVADAIDVIERAALGGADVM